MKLERDQLFGRASVAAFRPPIFIVQWGKQRYERTLRVSKQSI